MEICDKDGVVIGGVRTIWMVINYATREGVDISKLSYISNNISDRKSSVAPQGRLHMVTEATKSTSYTFKYTDCDINRHVNTVKYLELLMNQFPLEKYDKQLVRRLEIAFMHETRCGDTVEVNLNDNDGLDCKLSVDSGRLSHCRARFCFSPR